MLVMSSRVDALLRPHAHRLLRLGRRGIAEGVDSRAPGEPVQQQEREEEEQEQEQEQVQEHLLPCGALRRCEEQAGSGSEEKKDGDGDGEEADDQLVGMGKGCGGHIASAVADASLAVEKQKAEFYDRIGICNAFNPYLPDGRYILNLRHPVNHIHYLE